jgi:hypothetical protein
VVEEEEDPGRVAREGTVGEGVDDSNPHAPTLAARAGHGTRPIPGIWTGCVCPGP